jgi:lipopolysaccharide export system protein LptA
VSRCSALRLESAPRRRRAALALPTLLVALVVAAGPGLAQSLGVTSLDEDVPIEVEADQGIEWRRDEKLFVARGNASAKQGNVVVRADTLTARYREQKSGGNQIHNVEAVGRVRITSGDTSLEGDKGVYDIDNSLMTITGDKVVLVTPEQRVVAEKSMTFDNKRQIATAQGNATVVRGDQVMRADTLVAHFQRNAGGKMAIQRIEGTGNVHVSSPTEVARAGKGTYDLASGIATLTGAVRISRGENQLNGENAEVNLKTGVSRLTGAPGNPTGRVRALIVPGRSDQDRGGQAR